MSIPSPNQRISSFRNGYSSVYTYPFTLGFNPPIDPVILDFCRFFTICLAQIGPLVWRTVACLRYLSSKANVNFTFSHLIHLYHPNLIRHGVFTLTARSKKVLVNPEDDKDRGWYIRYVAVRTVDLIGETNIPFPEKWNFEPTMGDVEPIPNFRGWVDSLLKIATREQRTWKSISSLHGWKVKTHGFGIRGMTAEVAMAIRMSANAALDLDKARALLPKKSYKGNFNNFRLFANFYCSYICSLEVPENVAIPASEGETSTTQSVEVEASDKSIANGRVVDLDDMEALNYKLGPSDVSFETHVLAHIVATTLLPRTSSFSTFSLRDTFLLSAIKDLLTATQFVVGDIHAISKEIGSNVSKIRVAILRVRENVVKAFKKFHDKLDGMSVSANASFDRLNEAICNTLTYFLHR
ncbi:uncharacterized protein [Nicotiana sylvestris]|uniref:uncharacterized protein n=1 Tax=Nicotiana sylvestris TaxID=4096 RepID=UPI00388CACE2